MGNGEQLKKNLEYRKRLRKTKNVIAKTILEELERIIGNQSEKIIIVFPSLLDWNIPLFQRPQHIALNLAKEGVIYLYGTVNIKDQIGTVKEIFPQCYLVNMKEPEIEEAILSFLQTLKNRIVIHLYSGDLSRGKEFVKACLGKGFDILYEYVDELSSEIAGISIPRYAIERHSFLLSNPVCYVVATADKLYTDILQARPPERCALITNGVDYDHFSQVSTKIPGIMADLKKNGTPIIGYFGALASWFDYELVKKLAEQNPSYKIVLIGVDYDGSLKESGLLMYENIFYPGCIAYSELPSYAQHFDVSIIPFLVNEVTISTSPIKLFEYMAAGMPVVTTALPECRKYENIFVAVNHLDFLMKVQVAITMKDDREYRNTLKKEALRNKWGDKAKEILNLLKTK
ncbi:glycosyltransferase [Bacillus sp. FJAT-27225]|uniref:glycosyltransferase n=1 Tax=Bacillus sp. FJAT-27225 TaxID=1743144 RepID=UPI000AA3CD8F|nr:glycosyltransferase [Bacillus sp. FJAT-27225]